VTVVLDADPSSMAEIWRHPRARLPNATPPVQLLIGEALPRTRRGKLDH
jgi:hypothetical protein